MATTCQRSFFRARGRVGLRVERISEERWEVLERAIRADWSTPKEAPDSELTQWLERVEHKLDLLLERLEVPNPARALRTDTQDVVISGGGIFFSSQQCFEAGERLQLEIDVGTPGVWIRCLGRVIRCDAADAVYQTAVGFEVIREVDRDRIIEFALEAERRGIQERVESATL